MLGAYPVISADSHVNPPPFFWNDYLPAHLKDRAPKLESAAEGDFIFYEGRRAPITMLGAAAGQKFEDYKAIGSDMDLKELLRVSRPGGWEPAERLKDMDMDGVDAEVLYGGGPLTSADPEFCLATFRAYNDWLADFCSAAPDRFIGIAYIPTWDVDIAIRETEHAHRRGLRGVMIGAYPPAPPEEAGAGGQGGFLGWLTSGVSYNDPVFDPFWKKLIELNMAAHIHLGPALRPAGKPAPRPFLVGLTVGKLFMAEPIADAIFSGRFQRFPELMQVTVESGIGWGAFLVEYMDRNWERHRYHDESVLKEPPSFYFRRNIKATFLHDPVAIRERDIIGVDNIMWSSDYPHSDTTWPNSLDVIEEHLGGIPEDEKRKIVGENAAKLYNIRVGATA